MGFSGGMEGFLRGFSHGCRARVAEENLGFAVVGKERRESVGLLSEKTGGKCFPPFLTLFKR